MNPTSSVNRDSPDQREPTASPPPTFLDTARMRAIRTSPSPSSAARANSTTNKDSNHDAPGPTTQDKQSEKNEPQQAGCRSSSLHNNDDPTTPEMKKRTSADGTGERIPVVSRAAVDDDTSRSDESDGNARECSYSALVVITGGSKGIGKACVDSFARRGARVLFTYCSDHTSAARVEQSFVPRGRVQSRHLDQGDFDSVQSFAAQVDQWRDGRLLDTVVNNAALGVATVSTYKGLPTAPSAGSTKADDNDDDDGVEARRRRAEEDVALMRVNALGPMWVTESLLPMMEHPRAAPASVSNRDEDATTTIGGGEQKLGTPPSAAATETAAAAAAAAGTSTASTTFSWAAGRATTSSSSSGDDHRRKRTVLFVGSVGGGSQSVFPGFRAADAMSKAAVAYSCKHFAAHSRAATGGSSSSRTNSTPTELGKSGRDVTMAASDASGGVDFLCLCPGATLTDMFRASTLDRMQGPGELEHFLRALPQGRLMRPEEVAEAVYWFCSSPAATMFHGAVIDASAGLAVRPGVLTEYSF